MKNLKKVAIMVLACVMTFSLFACTSEEKQDDAKSQENYKIGIIQYIENGAFNDMREGIVNGLNDAGYVDGKNCTIDYQCAQADATNLNTICQTMSDGSYDLVFTIATPATQGMVALESETPVFFCAVSAPVAAGVISDMNKPDMNATGTSNAIPVSDIFALCDELTPDYKTVGLLYCQSEVNSLNTIKDAKKYLDSKKIKYAEGIASDSSEVQQAMQGLIGKCDIVFIPNDSVIQSAMPLVTEIARKEQIPVYGSSATMVDSGAFATIAISDKGIGEKTAAMAVQYLKGTAVADIPAIVVPADYTTINQITLDALGIDVADDLLSEATIVTKDAE